MTLWLLSPLWPTSEREPDTVGGFVIRAETEEAARQIADQNAGFEDFGDRHFWLNPLFSTCSILSEDDEPGIILRDCAGEQNDS